MCSPTPGGSLWRKFLHSGVFVNMKCYRAVGTGYQDIMGFWLFFLRYSILHNISKIKITPWRRRFKFLSPCPSLLLPLPSLSLRSTILKSAFLRQPNLGSGNAPIWHFLTIFSPLFFEFNILQPLFCTTLVPVLYFKTYAIIFWKTSSLKWKVFLEVIFINQKLTLCPSHSPLPLLGLSESVADLVFI